MRSTRSTLRCLFILLGWGGALLGCTGSASQGGVGGGSTSTVGVTTSGAGGGAPSGASASGAGGATGACAGCDGACVDILNDPQNCGACGHACNAAAQICDHGACAAAPCAQVGPICPLDHLCCGAECCPPWKMCCNVPGSSTPTCIPADAGACPTTCAGCP